MAEATGKASESGTECQRRSNQVQKGQQTCLTTIWMVLGSSARGKRVCVMFEEVVVDIARTGW